ncbi:hypothetical protein [Sphingomonas bacterium]|uniref:hypothetical protein n=1 Tax=Sphingomonas bacterium TaxID=1895847 RepID=UPI0015757840|nr:hypothetical protein [Sphingomonas bacterium]
MNWNTAMDNFPDASQLQHLVDDTLMQVCLDPYSTQFHFERNRIMSELSVEQVEPDGTTWSYSCVAAEAGANMLHRLVGKVVKTVATEALTMTITFENGAVLRVLSEIGPYEAGHIDGEGGFIVF